MMYTYLFAQTSRAIQFPLAGTLTASHCQLDGRGPLYYQKLATIPKEEQV